MTHVDIRSTTGETELLHSSQQKHGNSGDEDQGIHGMLSPRMVLAKRDEMLCCVRDGGIKADDIVPKDNFAAHTFNIGSQTSTA